MDGYRDSAVRCTRSLVQVVIVVALVAAAGPKAVAVTVEWTGASGDCLWSNQNNWDPALAGPVNAGALTFDIVIPEGLPSGRSRICFDIEGDSEITSLVLGAGATLELQPGCNLTVTGAAELGGTVYATNANFTADGPEVAFVGDRAQTWAQVIEGEQAEAVVTISAETYSGTGLFTDWGCCSGSNTHTLFPFSAAGEGAEIRLQALTSIDSGFNDFTTWDRDNDSNQHFVWAEDGALIDLSALETTTAPRNGNDSLNFVVATGGRILLPELATVDTVSGGKTWFTNLDETGLHELPKLETFARGGFWLAGGEIRVGDRLTALTNVRFHLEPGSTFLQNSTDVTYDARGMFSDWGCCNGANTHERFLVEAIGPDTFIDLSSIVSIDSGFNDFTTWDRDNDTNYHFVRADQGAVIDLSALERTTAPRNGNDSLNFVVATGGRILLPELATVDTVSGGKTWFTNLDETGLHELPKLETFTRGGFWLAGGEIRVGDRLTALTNVRFHLEPGSTFLQNSTDVTYDARGMFSDWGCCNGANTHERFLVEAIGPDTFIDLSSIVSIDSGFNDFTTWDRDNDQNGHWIKSSAGAIVDVSELRTITAPRNGNDWFGVRAESGGTILLNSLEALPSAGSGATWVMANAATLSIASVRDEAPPPSSEGDTPLNSGRVRLVTEESGTILVGRDVELDAQSRVSLSPSSTLVVSGSFTCSGPLTSDLAALEVTGDVHLGDGDFRFRDSVLLTEGSVAFTHIAETTFQALTSTLALVGGGVQELEVGGLDVDVQTDLRPLGNFGWGSMVIGQPDTPTRVRLVSNHVNATPAPPEALYLFGIDAEPGLAIHPGSSLVLGEFNAYALLEGELQSLRRRCQSGVCVVPPGGLIEIDDVAPVFRRGRLNNDGNLDLTDGVTILGFLFLGSPTILPCEDAADVNDNGEINLTDAVNLFGHLFLGDAAPPAPFESCGGDPTADGLSCVVAGDCP